VDVQVFWNVISTYNSYTLLIQIALFLFLISAMVLSYLGKIKWLAKFSLGVVNLFIGIVFFGLYGVEPIQKFFALPLYLCCGFLFLLECIKNKDDTLSKPDRGQSVLLLLYSLYPFISMLLGNRFPQMVTYIMPCPIISLSIAVYAGYGKKNRLLLLLLTIWGLTGIKSIIFHAYEDIILLISGIYGIFLIMSERKRTLR
jgi:hypothetical protein